MEAPVPAIPPASANSALGRGAVLVVERLLIKARQCGICKE
jgi:hypothetical protein